MSSLPFFARAEAMLRRSYLFLPANRIDRVSKAAASGADALILDLEDSVADTEVDAARDHLSASVRLARDTAAVPVHVRVNAGPMISLDIAAAVAAGADGVVAPKIETAADVISVHALLDAAERRFGSRAGSTEVLLLVESARGMAALGEIASAGSRTIGLALGVEDLATDLEIDPQSKDFDLGWAHGLLICHARANGIVPLGLLRSLSEIRDLDAFERDAFRSRAFGYMGALCIHPAQILPLHRAFSPSQEEVRQARAVLAALEDAELVGSAAAQIDGRMVDTPMAIRANRVLRRAGNQTH